MEKVPYIALFSLRCIVHDKEANDVWAKSAFYQVQQDFPITQFNLKRQCQLFLASLCIAKNIFVSMETLKLIQFRQWLPSECTETTCTINYLWLKILALFSLETDGNKNWPFFKVLSVYFEEIAKNC